MHFSTSFARISLLTFSIAAVVPLAARAQDVCVSDYREIEAIDRGTTPDCLALEPGEQATNLTGQEIIITNNCAAEYLVRCTADFGVDSDCGLRRTVAPGAADTLAVGSASRDLIAEGDSEQHRIEVQWINRTEPCDEGCSAAGRSSTSHVAHILFVILALGCSLQLPFSKKRSLTAEK